MGRQESLEMYGYFEQHVGEQIRVNQIDAMSLYKRTGELNIWCAQSDGRWDE